MRPSTFLDALIAGGESTSTAFVFLPDDGGAPVSLARDALERRARAVGQALAERFAPGDRVLVLCPPGLDYIVAFLGCLYGGVVAVPAYPPDPAQLARTLPRLQGIARDAGAVAVLTVAMVRELGGAMSAWAPDLAGLPLIAVDEVPDARAADWRRPPVHLDTVAFLQYTSGSTGDPRGVRVTQANLAANSEQIAAVRGHDPDPRGVSWLPPYHDMGLIGCILQPLYFGAPMVLMSPLAFLRQPLRWLEAITRWRATASATPNFALDLCCRRIFPAEREGLDLSSMRHLFVGAEPVRADTIDRFLEAFGPCGFPADAIRPSYGLAEATLMVSGGGAGRHDGRIACGTPAAEVAIVDPEGKRVEPGGTGEIWVRGPQVAAGYHGNERSDEVFEAVLDGGPGWLRTGDLGYLHHGQLYVAGRIKDVIVRRGRNVHPQDLEASAERCHPAVRPGGVAIFADAEERIVVVAEVGDPAAIASVTRAVRDAIAFEHDLPVDRLVCVAPRSLPKTSSGKLRRSATREALDRGELAVLEPPAVGPVTGPMYPGLDARVEALDRRPTRYQFDLDRDVEWHRIDEPGEHLPRRLAAFGWAEGLPLWDDPEARAVFQWTAGISLCDTIATLEEGLVRFLVAETPDLGGHHTSLELLGDEERKHVALFRRYADLLRARRPDLAPIYDAALERCWVPLAFDSPIRTEDPLAYHYQAWLQVLVFEEWSLWFHERLAAERDDVQPAWFSAQRAHAREESQHVLTGDAWLSTLALDEDRRTALSRARLTEVMGPMQFSNRIIREVCTACFPEHAAALARPNPSAPLLALIREPAFVLTRKHAPWFQVIADRALPAQTVTPPAVRRVPTLDQARGWLDGWIRARRAQGPTDGDATFNELGLDSADMLGLAGEIDEWVGGTLQPTLPYEFPTPKLLAGYLSALPPLPAAIAITTAPSAERPVGVRQARWLDVAEHQDAGLAHNVTEIWELAAPVDEDTLRAALARVTAAHPQLQRRFARTATGCTQVEAADTVELRVSDAEEPLHARLAAVAAEAWARPFDWRTDPSLRVVLVRAPDGQGLVCAAPHVVTDGASIFLFGHQLVAACAGEHVAPAPDPADLAREEAGWLRTEEARRRLDWWRGHLADLPDWDARIGGHPRQDRMDGRRVAHRLSPAIASRWTQRAQRLGVTPFLLLLTALHLAWRRVHGLSPVIGTQLSGRSTPERARMFGFLVDVALVRAELDDARDLDEAVPRMARAWLQAVQNAVTVDAITAELFPERRLDRWLPAPLSFNFIPGADEPYEAGTLRSTRTPHLLPDQRSFLYYEEMVVAYRTADQGMVLVHWYDQGRHAPETVAAVFDALADLLGEGPAARHQPGSAGDRP